MPRKAREKSKSGFYHVMLRGINRQIIFMDEEDNKKFLQILFNVKGISGFKLFGYCLMENHIHMLIKTEKEELSQIIKRIGSRYVYWYNSKYNRTGHLFQDRYKSQPIEDDSHFLATLRYIHQNPLKAGLCKKLSDYEWSSYKDYCNKKGITDTSFALDLLGKYFFKFMREESNDKCLEIEAPKPKLTDSELYKKICQELKVDPLKIASETRNKRNELLRRILAFEGVSTRQISRVTGVSANIIWNL